MVTVRQVHHISVSALTFNYNIMVFKAKHEVHFCEESIEDGGEECHSERLLLKKKESLEKLFSMESTSGSCNGTKRWLHRRKEWHRLCHVGKLLQSVSSLLLVLSLSC